MLQGSVVDEGGNVCMGVDEGVRLGVCEGTSSSSHSSISVWHCSGIGVFKGSGLQQVSNKSGSEVRSSSHWGQLERVFGLTPLSSKRS